MNRKTRTWLAALVLTLGLGATARADFPFPPFHCPWHESPDCPRSSYCCLHYWTPWVYKFWAYHTEPRYVYGCYSDGPLGYRIYSYPCRATDGNEQAQKYIEVGTAPKNADEGTPSTEPPSATQQQGTSQQPPTLPPPAAQPVPAKPAK
jgi:hypothetical protein